MLDVVFDLGILLIFGLEHTLAWQDIEPSEADGDPKEGRRSDPRAAMGGITIVGILIPVSILAIQLRAGRGAQPPSNDASWTSSSPTCGCCCRSGACGACAGCKRVCACDGSHTSSEPLYETLTEPDRTKGCGDCAGARSPGHLEEGAGMNDEAQHCEEGARCARALKVRIAAISTTGLVVSLAVVPEALARLAVNHNETVLALE